MATDVSAQSLKKNLIFLFQLAFPEVTPVSAQFSDLSMIGTHYTQTPHVYQLPLSTSGSVFGLGSTFQVWALFKSVFILSFLLGPLRSPPHEYRLPDSQGCMECLSRPSMPISFPESPCLALWYSTTSHQKLQPQARRAAGFSPLLLGVVLLLFSPDKAGPIQQQSCCFQRLLWYLSSSLE